MTNDQTVRRRAPRKPSDYVVAMRRLAISCPDDLQLKAIGMVEILATLRDCDTKRRRVLARRLSPDLPEYVSGRVCAVVNREADALPELYEIFRQWLHEESEKLKLKRTACYRCDPPRRGNMCLPHVGWVCREHYRDVMNEIPTTQPTQRVNVMEAILGIQKLP